MGLNIHDNAFADELLSLQAPLHFIDFEALQTNGDAVPAATPGTQIPSQFSNHILSKGGLEWDGALYHDEYLWQGDWGKSPVYSFVDALYESTKDAGTILVWSDYELSKLKLCAWLAEQDIAALEAGELPDGFTVPVGPENRAVRLEDVAYDIEWKCNSMMSRIYDLLYGWKGGRGGFSTYIHSPDLHGSYSIKAVEPLASASYTQTRRLLAACGLPENGYAGLRAEGNIAKGDQCINAYTDALRRPIRQGVGFYEDGAAPFDAEVARQCLRYCSLDTLSMVIAYLAVLEDTERWRRGVSGVSSGYARFMDDGLIHKYAEDGGALYKDCCGYGREYSKDEASILLQADIDMMAPRSFYGALCRNCS